MEALVIEICESVLSFSPIGLDDDLFDYGLDSIGIMQIRSILEDALGLRLPLAVFFEEQLSSASLVGALNAER